MKRYALSAVGRDKPGIVAAVTKALYEHGCNIEDSSMTTLEDEFAIILIMSMPEGKTPALSKELKRVEKKMGLSIHFKEISTVPQRISPPGNYIISLHGADHAGIVFKTAQALARLGVNITDIETKIVGTAAKVYIMLIEVFIPDEADRKKAEEELKALEKELGVTIKIKPVEAFEPL